MKPISPWDARLYSIRQRCSGNPRLSHTCYFKNKIKCLITADEIKDLWFRDKADLMDKPSIDSFEQCEYNLMQMNEDELAEEIFGTPYERLLNEAERRKLNVQTDRQ